MKKKSAVDAINKHGVLLVYPINNAKDPLSLWSVFYPRSQMDWEWDEEGDSRVSDLWHLRAELSTSRKVVYTKWYRGRATFFSREVFTALLAAQLARPHLVRRLSSKAKLVLETLESDSPLSTKQLKRATGLTGRMNEPAYQRALKELWSSLLIVGFGEVDEGAFPSLAIGATRVLFEDIWREAQSLSERKRTALIERLLPAGSKLRRFFEQSLRERDNRRVDFVPGPGGHVEFSSES